MRKRISRKYPMSDAMLVLFVRLMIMRLLRDLAVLGAKFGLTTAKLTELGTECTAFDERHCSCLRGERRGWGRFKRCGEWKTVWGKSLQRDEEPSGEEHLTARASKNAIYEVRST